MAKVVKLANYKGIQVHMKNRMIFEEDIQQIMFSILKEHAPYIDIKRPVEIQDSVILSVKGYVDEKYIEEISIPNICIKIGTDSFGKGFDEQIIGMHLNEIRNVSMTYDSNYNVKELAQKTVKYRVKILEHFKQSEIEFTDEFVESMDFNELTTVQELREYALNELRNEYLEVEHEEIRQQIIQHLIDNSILEISEEEIEKKIDDEITHTIDMFKKADIEFDEILNLLKVDMETYRKHMISPCSTDLKLDLIYNEIAKLEGMDHLEEKDYLIDQIIQENMILIRN